MSWALQRLLQQLGAARACLVSVDATQGSAPREVGAWMAVFEDGGQIVGTIGGGHLELEAIADAHALLAREDALPLTIKRWALGPSLGQCCGGVVHLRFELVTADDVPALRERLRPDLHPLALFGGGHVGAALVNVLATLPFAVRWIDSRDSVFPDSVPAFVECEHSDPVEAAVADLREGSRVLIMSFSHAEDLNIVAACLRRQRERADLPFVGLIGSATKRATFTTRLRQRGFAQEEIAHITSPIGITGITGKQPEVIAVSVAAQLLLTLEQTGTSRVSPR